MIEPLIEELFKPVTDDELRDRIAVRRRQAESDYRKLRHKCTRVQIEAADEFIAAVEEKGCFLVSASTWKVDLYMRFSGGSVLGMEFSKLGRHVFVYPDAEYAFGGHRYRDVNRMVTMAMHGPQPND